MGNDEGLFVSRFQNKHFLPSTLDQAFLIGSHCIALIHSLTLIEQVGIFRNWLIDPARKQMNFVQRVA